MNKITMLKLFYVIGLFENGFVINSWQQLLLETHEDNNKFDIEMLLIFLPLIHFHPQKFLSKKKNLSINQKGYRYDLQIAISILKIVVNSITDVNLAQCNPCP